MEKEVLIPFGKYRGQPIEVMAQDKQYMDWVQQQGWLAEKYPQINTLIINNFAAPSETPEHNKMQGMFLDDDFVLRFVRACLSVGLGTEKLNDYIKLVLDKFDRVTDLLFEKNAIDVQFCIESISYIHSDWKEPYRDGNHFTIEIKPSLGDDYPSVLRQIRSLKDFSQDKINILFIGNYSGTGVTKDQVIKLFRTQGIIVVSLSDIPNT